MLYSLSNLDSESLKVVKSLEQEIGNPLIAMSEIEVANAPLGGEKLQKLKSIEEKLGVVLIAVKPTEQTPLAG